MTRICPECGTSHTRENMYCDGCEFLTQPEAAARMRISKPTYYRMVRAGVIHPRRVGVGKIVVERAEVERILRGRGL